MVKFILRHIPKGKLSYTFTKKKTRHKIPIKSTKTTIIKVPKGKAPAVGPEKLTATQIELRSKTLGDKSHRMKFGKDTTPSHIAEEGIRAESIAYPIQERVFNRQLKKYLRSERNIVAKRIKKMGANQRGMIKPTKVTPSFRTPKFKVKHTATWATGPLGNNPKGLSIYGKHDKPFKLNIGKTRLVESKKLKSMKKGAAIKAYNKADKKASKIYQKAMLRFSGKSKHSSTRINMMASKPIVHDKTSDRLIYSTKKNIMDRRDEARYISKQRKTVEDWGKDYDAFPDTDDMMVLTRKQQSKRFLKSRFKPKKKK